MKAHGSTYHSKNCAASVSVKAIGFVDDVRTSINAFENNTITLDQLVAMASQDSQPWHDILVTCNQQLERPKCSYHAIMFDFEPTGKPSMIEDPACPLTLQDTTGCYKIPWSPQIPCK